MDCRQLDFNPRKSEERIERALHVFSPKLLYRMIAFALYMVGAKRKAVAVLVGIPEQSLKTLIRVVLQDGYEALLDRRMHTAPSKPEPALPHKGITVDLNGGWVIVKFPLNNTALKMPVEHPIQVRTVLLTMVDSGLLSAKEVAPFLNISPARCRELANQLSEKDVDDVLIDKRIGQRKDYKVGPHEKAIMIQHFVARVVTGHPASSKVLADQINQETRTNLSSRTVRWHMKKLGLLQMKKTLPAMVNELKKNCL